MDFVKELGNASHYERQIEILHAKSFASPRFLRIIQDGVSLKNFFFDKVNISKKLARLVGSGRYVFSPPKIRKVMLDKERILYSFELTDYIVNGVVSKLIGDAANPHLSRRVFSYRRGKSQWHAAHELARFVRKHLSKHPDPKQRGLYVLRRDIKSYSPSIPMAEDSLVWRQLKDCLLPHFESEEKFSSFFPLIKTVVHPIPTGKGAKEIDISRGLPVGSQITPVINNLYTTPLDAALEKIPGAYYARFGDDIAFCHQDPKVTKWASGQIDTILESLRLEVGRKKSKDLYFNGAGKIDPDHPDFKGTQTVKFLGFDLSFRGTLLLPVEKKRKFLDDLRNRLKLASSIINKDCSKLSWDQKGKLICHVLNNALDCDHPYCHRHTLSLLRVMTDREQMRELDYWMARLVVGTITGDKGVRGFRKVPYKKIRSEWALTSLFHKRNKKQHAPVTKVV